MESFHRERVRAIMASDAPFRLKAGLMMVVHLIPEETVRSCKRFTASELKAHGGTLAPLGEQSGRNRFNAEGYAVHDYEAEVGAYTQLHRDGRLEGVTANVAYTQYGVRVLNNDLCERAIIEVMNQYQSFCRGLGILLPIWLFVALVGCEDVRGSTWHEFRGEAVHRQLVFLPDFQVDSFDAVPASYLRSLFDCLANVVGLERSPNHDEHGNRSERRS